MSFKILDVFQDDGHLVVRVQHFQNDLPWFKEDYVWQGREGLKRKRMTNAKGEILLGDQTVAPFDEDGHQFLPPGAKWRYRAAPHMDENSILSVIRSIHAERLFAGTPYTDGTSTTNRPSSNDDRSGVGKLIAKFAGLKGRTE